MARQRQINEQPEDTRRQLQILDYQLAHEGYRYRDQLIPQEFFHMLQTFVLFTALLAGTKVFLELDRGFATIVFLLVAIVGAFALGGFLVDIQANASCKGALRRHTSDFEEKLDPTRLLYWKAIENRTPFRHEFFFKCLVKVMNRGKDEGSATKAFIWAAMLLFYFWIVLAIVFVFCGHAIVMR